MPIQVHLIVGANSQSLQTEVQGAVEAVDGPVFFLDFTKRMEPVVEDWNTQLSYKPLESLDQAEKLLWAEAEKKETKMAVVYWPDLAYPIVTESQWVEMLGKVRTLPSWMKVLVVNVVKGYDKHSVWEVHANKVTILRGMRREKKLRKLRK